MEIRRIEENTKEYDAMQKLRSEVLLEPIGYKLTAAEKEEEKKMIHLGGFSGNLLVATLALSEYDDETVKIGRFCVRQEMQASGFGRELLSFAEEIIRKMEYENVVVHARKTAVGFYRKCGYTEEGDDFVEATVLHVKMVKKL